MKRILPVLILLFGICLADTCPVCPAQPTYLYEFINLNYGETWSAQWIYPGLFVSAPPVPTYNLTWNLSYGESKYLAEANITCIAPNLSAINKNDTIDPNQTISYPQWNYSVTAVPCQIPEPAANSTANSTNSTCPAAANSSENLGYIILPVILFTLAATLAIEIVLYFIRRR